MSSLHLRGISASYGSGASTTPVLHDINLDVDPGDLVALLGPSGCGKTTLLRTIAGFITPSSGHILLGETDVVSTPPEQRGIGLVPQEGALFPHLDVFDNIAFGLVPNRAMWPSFTWRRRSGIRDRVNELLDVVGLSGLGNRRPSELSGGQQQRVALARALAPHPRVILMDEPFSALDPSLRESVRADVSTALRHSGATAILVTHDQDEALSMADQVAVLHHGRIVMSDTPQRVYTQPVALEVARFVGKVVELPARRELDFVETALGRLRVATDSHLHTGAFKPTTSAAGAALVSSPNQAEKGDTALLTNRDVQVGTATVRPEQIVIHHSPRPDRIAGLIRDLHYHGHDTALTIELMDHPGQLVTARTNDAVSMSGVVHLSVHGAARFYPNHDD